MYKSYKVLAVGVFRGLYAVQLLKTIQPLELMFLHYGFYLQALESGPAGALIQEAEDTDFVSYLREANSRVGYSLAFTYVCFNQKYFV